MPLYGGFSQTVPDEALTVREIIDRFTRGIPCPVFHESNDDDQYLDEDEHMNIQDLDDFEKRQLMIDFEERKAPAAGGEPAAADEVKASGQGDQGEQEASPVPDSIEKPDSQ